MSLWSSFCHHLPNQFPGSELALWAIPLKIHPLPSVPDFILEIKFVPPNWHLSQGYWLLPTLVTPRSALASSVCHGPGMPQLQLDKYWVSHYRKQAGEGGGGRERNIILFSSCCIFYDHNSLRITREFNWFSWLHPLIEERRGERKWHLFECLRCAYTMRKIVRSF